jgi:hypothetical protein
MWGNQIHDGEIFIVVGTELMPHEFDWALAAGASTRSLCFVDAVCPHGGKRKRIMVVRWGYFAGLEYTAFSVPDQNRVFSTSLAAARFCFGYWPEQTG